MKAYTYLIINKLTNKWYYGVRYAKNCKISDMMNIYFSSCHELQADIILLGKENFYCEIRKEFSDVDLAKKWEVTVLRRMNVVNDINCYNKHFNMGFAVMLGDDNPSRREDVREKLSIKAIEREKQFKVNGKTSHITKIKDTKIKNNIVKLFKNQEFVIAKVNIKKYKNYIDWLLLHKPDCKRIICKLETLVELSGKIQNKIYPKNRESGGYKSKPAISKTKMGERWYTNPEKTKVMVVKQGCSAPLNWIAGNKLQSKHESSKSFLGKTHSDESKNLMSIIAKSKMYYTNYT